MNWLLAWVGLGFVFNEIEKRQVEAKATKLVQKSGKPIINIGARCNPFGDIRCDIAPRCKGVKYCDAENLTQYGDKEFSVAVLSHVLEHLDDPDQALTEAYRIADYVLVITPSPIWPQTWLDPTHKWVFLSNRKIRIRTVE